MDVDSRKIKILMTPKAKLLSSAAQLCTVVCTFLNNSEFFTNLGRFPKLYAVFTSNLKYFAQANYLQWQKRDIMP
jgi:hypothetical protein